MVALSAVDSLNHLRRLIFPACKVEHVLSTTSTGTYHIWDLGDISFIPTSSTLRAAISFETTETAVEASHAPSQVLTPTATLESMGKEAASVEENKCLSLKRVCILTMDTSATNKENYLNKECLVRFILMHIVPSGIFYLVV